MIEKGYGGNGRNIRLDGFERNLLGVPFFNWQGEAGRIKNMEGEGRERFYFLGNRKIANLLLNMIGDGK